SGGFFGSGAAWRLYSPEDRSLVYSSFYPGWGAGSLDFDVTLPVDGTYTLIADPADPARPVDYRFRVVDEATTAIPYTLNTTLTGTLDPGRRQDRYTFTGSAGQQIYVDSLDSQHGVPWRIVGPNGRIAFGDEFGFSN